MPTATQELLKAWYLFCFSIGFYTCLNLVFFAKGDKKINTTLLMFVVLLLVPSLNAYVQAVAGAPIHWLQSLSQNLTWAYGPLLLLVVQHALLQRVPKRLAALHFVPLVLVNVYRLFDHSASAPANYFFPMLFLQTFIYSSFTLYLLIKHKSRLLTLVTHHANTTYYWLLFLAACLLGLSVYDLLIIHFLRAGFTLNMPALAAISAAISLYVCLITLFALYQPTLFFNTDGEQPLKAPSPPPASTDDAPKIRNIELTPSTAAALNQQLKALTESHLLHLDEAMSLAKLASLLGVTRSQLSELFNVHNNTSFYEFLNDLRYQESVKLLQRTDTQFSIADIAFQSGFNNRNSFYKVFKDKTGVTPSEFRRQAKMKIENIHSY